MSSNLQIADAAVAKEASSATIIVKPSQDPVPDDDKLELSGKPQADDMDFVRVPLSRFEFICVFLSFACAVFLVSLDTTIISTAIPAIASEFQALDQVDWIGSAFLLTSTAFSPIYGTLCDIFGRKVIFLLAIVLFEAGSLLCAVAPNMISLIMGRALAGVGAGGLFTVVLVMISDVTSLRDSSKYQGVIGAVFGLSSVIGPLLGGVFTDHLNWRWCFWINLPFGGIAAGVVFFLLKFPAPEGTIAEKLHRLDLLGTFFIVSATAVVLVGPLC